jgi:hypothetical protein
MEANARRELIASLLQLCTADSRLQGLLWDVDQIWVEGYRMGYTDAQADAKADAKPMSEDRLDEERER